MDDRLVTLCGLPMAMLAAGAAGLGTPWYQQALVGMEVGPTGAQFGAEGGDPLYAARFNGSEIVRRCREAGSEYVVVWARDGVYAYYDSAVQPKAPGLRERDVLREAVREGRRLGMPIIAYCVLQYPTTALAEHPEWAMRDADGKPIPDRVCFNSPYREHVKDLLKEMLAYGIDGFHLDMVDQGFGPPHGCWCDHCARLYEARYGAAMPTGVTWDESWNRMLELRYETSAGFERELTQFIRSEAPGVTVDYNYHGNPPFSWEVGQRPVQHAVNGDFVTGETGIWGFSALTTGLNVEIYRAATPGRPVQVAMQRGVRMYHDQTTRPLADMQWELYTLLAHGAFVTMVDKTAYDGWLDPVAYERIGELFAEARRRRDEFGHAPVADVALWFSDRSRDWYGRQDPSRYFAGFLGAHKAMTYEHLPWSVVLEENASLATLKQTPVVLLPNAAIVGEATVRLLSDYVTGGGNLIVTGISGCFDHMGQPRPHSALENLIGGRLVRPLESRDNHVRFARGQGPEALTAGLRPDWPFLVEGPAVVYEATEATAIGELLAPHRTVRQIQGLEATDWPMSAGETVGPAALLNQLGSGQVLTLACSPDAATSGEHPIVEARRLLANAVRLLAPEPRVRVDAPVTVEVVVRDDPERRILRVHLIGYSAPPQTLPARNRPYVLPGLMEEPPIYEATVTLRDRPRSLRVVGRADPPRRDGRRIALTVRDTHAVLVVGY